MIITSQSNQQIKDLRKLKSEKEFLFLDNPKLIDEAISAKCEIYKIIFEEGKDEKFSHLKKYNFIIASKDVFKSISSATTSQGVVAMVKFGQKTFKPPSENFLVLDEVQDPGNVGTLIRSALAFGFQDIYLINSASPTNEKVVRSTMGALFKVNIFEIDRKNFVNCFKDKNLFCGIMDGKNVSSIKFPSPCGIVIGNEGNGVSREIQQICTGVSIPMNDGVESLNASVAGSILMFKVKGDI